ncbi:hypothetical protein J6590_046735 [Homalodisca vitripennis]|nr:hypothetical protein J6590_046735 [Homalodisca vitripennis]
MNPPSITVDTTLPVPSVHYVNVHGRGRRVNARRANGNRFWVPGPTDRSPPLLNSIRFHIYLAVTPILSNRIKNRIDTSKEFTALIESGICIDNVTDRIGTCDIYNSDPKWSTCSIGQVHLQGTGGRGRYLHQWCNRRAALLNLLAPPPIMCENLKLNQVYLNILPDPSLPLVESVFKVPAEEFLL